MSKNSKSSKIKDKLTYIQDKDQWHESNALCQVLHLGDLLLDRKSSQLYLGRT